MKKNLHFLAIFAMIFMISCNKEDITTGHTVGDKITIGISASNITQTALPVSKTGNAEDVFAIQIYSAEADGGTFTPYAQGLFTDWTNLSFEGVSGNSYKIEATLVKDASGKIQKIGDVYAKPFNASVSNTFAYNDVALSNLTLSETTLLDGTNYTVPTIDRYLGIVTKVITNEDANIDLSMKRVSFGIQNKSTEELNRTLVINVAGAPEVELQPSNTSEIVLYSFANILDAYNADEASAPYSESLKVEIFNNGINVLSQNVNFMRNKLSIITINAVGEFQFDINFEIPFEDKVTVVGDNLYYNETQLNVEQNYWVVLENREQEATAQKAINWYVNNELVGNGAELKFTPTTAGENTIKYTVSSAYSNNAEAISKEVITKTYSSNGVYILNEPNMTAIESIRGINQHTFGSSTVDRFITGDYTSFGMTNQYIANWAGKIYNVAPYSQGGIAFSQFTALGGTFVKAIASLPGGAQKAGHAFAGVTPEVGVLTTQDGAYLVNLTDLTLSNEIMNGSQGSLNVLVADGYVFMITSGGAKAYKVNGLSTTSEPIVLGSAKTGFVQSKDGHIWAANGGTLLRINSRDLSTKNITLPDGGTILFPSSPWKQVSWVASTAENAFFYTHGSSWGSAKEVRKYDINSGTVTNNFIKSSEDTYNHMLYGTCLFYDAQRDELICQTLKGYGGNSAYNGIHMFNALTGVKSYEVLYDTTADIYGEKDMWFPAMMAPMKTY